VGNGAFAPEAWVRSASRPYHFFDSRHSRGGLKRQSTAVASANEVTMRTTSESLSPSEASHGREAEGNCVAVRRGGEQPEAKPQTQTQVKPIRPPTMASLLANGEACGASRDRPDRHNSSQVRDRIVAGGWAGYAGKLSWWTVESCAGRNLQERVRTEVRAAIVAWKRGNARGAKGGRKVERPRP
jgi:hypothetical protein